jgi:hypothetical protein
VCLVLPPFVEKQAYTNYVMCACFFMGHHLLKCRNIRRLFELKLGELYEKIVQPEMQSTDGNLYKPDVANVE